MTLSRSIPDPDVESLRAGSTAVYSTLATMVRRLRTNSAMTIEDLERESGIPADSLRGIENATVHSSVRAIWSLARVFEVPFRVLITGSVAKNSDLHVLRASEGGTIVSSDGSYRARSLATGFDPREPELYEVALAPGCIEEAPAHVESTHEHIFVLRGTLRVRTPASVATLAVGDAAFFRADSPHAYENPGDSQAVALITMINGGDWVVG